VGGRYVHRERDVGRRLGDRIEDYDFRLLPDAELDHDDVFND
jgi:hypothetical protein